MKISIKLFTLLLLGLFVSCKKDILSSKIGDRSLSSLGITKVYRINIDSSYAYQGDSLYKSMAREYHTKPTNEVKIKRSKAKGGQKSNVGMTPEDDAFFSKKHTVKSTEAMLYQGRNFIFPGAVLEGNSISKQNYSPIFPPNRKPITVSMSLTHTTPKPTSRVIVNPTFSKLDDYVKEMAMGGSFKQNEKFMFQYRRFTFYDEIKQAFGTDVNTRRLFSSKSENSTSESHKILESTGMYVKFFQASFTVNMDIGPLADQAITGNSGEPPVYVNSVTYGRMGIIVIETDKEYQFAETCIKKEFDRIFYNKTETLTTEEKKFFEETQFKVLIMGGDSDYTVQTFKGYPHFLNLIFNSKFTETSFGVPIACSFSDANTHQLVETEFVNTTYIDPLYVKVSRENSVYEPDASSNNYRSSANIVLNFFKDRQKSKPAYPYTDIFFEVEKNESNCKMVANQLDWPEILMDCNSDSELLKLRNINISNRLSIGTELSSYESNGPEPSDPSEPRRNWSAIDHHLNYQLKSSPFFIVIN
nr:thiol-activated cytolysin family protein [uncultured Sphingobacterium sp.]